MIQELEDSDLSKDKEMMNILDDIRQKSLFFGGRDGYDMSDSDLAAKLPDVEMSDESKAALNMLGKSSSMSDESSSIGIKKDYSTDEATITLVLEDKLDAIDPNQLYEVQCDDNMKQLSDKSDSGWKYVATLKAFVESCSEEEEEGEETEIMEVQQCGNRIDLRRFYGKKVVKRTAASRDEFRLRLMKRFLARDRAAKAKCRLPNQSDSMHSDTSVSDGDDVLSLISNTTYSKQNSDECQSNDNRKGKNYVVINTSESDAGSMLGRCGQRDPVQLKFQNLSHRQFLPLVV